MGRYFSERGNDSFEGKFLFGIQSSTAADRFGVAYSEPNYVTYFYDTDDLETVSSELDDIEQWLREKKNISIDALNLNSLRQPDALLHEEVDTKYLKPLYDLINESTDRELISELADYELGIQIEWTIRKYLSAELECEL
jgi:hypothetical protein